MSSAFRSRLCELLAKPEARAARRGRAFLVLDARLSVPLLSNEAGAKAFGIGADGELPTVLARQVGSGARVLAERGAAALLLRVPAGRTLQAIAARATRIGEGDEGIVVLAAENGEAASGTEPHQLLAALGFAADEATIFGLDGALAAGEPASGDLAEPLAAFVSDDAEARTIEAGGCRFRILRIDDRFLLVEPTVAADAAELSAPAPGEEPTGQQRGVAPDEPIPSEPAFVARFEAAPIRFVWQIDAEGRFRSLSPEFTETVGPRSADVVGRTFGEVADEFGIDANGAIRRLLERHDTWSGRTVLWPVENTDQCVPIDLAALPTYSRERAFDGFRGFGIIRVADHETDPDARGLRLSIVKEQASEPSIEAEPEPELAIEAPRRKPVFRAFEADLPGVSFGRRETPPVPAIEDAAGEVARVPADRRRPAEATLSEAERAAFREIGAKLGHAQTEAKTPGALRFERSGAARPVPIEGKSVRIEAVGEPEAGAAASAGSPHADDERKGTPEPVDGGADVSPDIRTVLARLPLPAIVQGMDALVFANRAFLDFAGYDDIESLNRAGGLDALFAEPAVDQAEAHALTVRRANGDAVEASVRMQRIAFAGRSSLLMTFEHEPPAVPTPDDGRDLRRELMELRAVLDIATDGVVLVDPAGIVRSANGSAQALFGMAENEFRGKPVSALFAQESQKVVSDYFETLKDKGLAGIMNDGREVIGRVAQGGFVPLFITAGRVSEERGWCVVIRDMSHWKRIEEELVNARRAAEAASLHKSRFLANISHELRTPLNAIIGFADVMASECFGPIGSERYIEYLGDIKRSGHHVLDLVNDLLDISKIEAGRMELTFESVSLNEVLLEVVSTMQPQANRERVIVRSNLPASVPPVVADRRTIRQIALNLLSNSVRFTPAGGQVIASTTYTADGSVLLRVRDSGLGMTASEIELALTPFQQVQKPGDTRNEGTGLGLPLTKAMTEANRASFAIRSTPGEGTLVEIAFPAPRVLLD